MVCHDRYAKDLICWIPRKELLPQSFCLAAEHERVVHLEIRAMVDPSSEFREEPYLSWLSGFDISLPGPMTSELYVRPIIQPGAANRLLGEVKTEGPHEVEWGIGSRAGAGD
jgi:hypothetical protein